MTITNHGNTNENNILLTLPAKFSISTGSGNNRNCSVVGSLISDNLQPNDSCDITITYDNNIATPQATNNIHIRYNYDDGKPSPSTTTTSVNYKVTQASAILAFAPSIYTFTDTILNNNIEKDQYQINLQNSGDDEATNLVFNFSGTGAVLFSHYNSDVGSECTTTLHDGASCDYGVQFGSAESTVAAGSKVATLNLAYTPYSGGTTRTTTATFNGQVATAQSAIFDLSITDTGFAGGNGRSSTPYAIQKDRTSSKITFIFTNTGNSAASNAWLDVATTSSGWSITNNCGTNHSKITVNKNSNCTVEAIPITTTTGSNNLVINWVGHWNDAANPNGVSSDLQQTIYSTVYAPASINITNTLQFKQNMLPGSKFNIIATLTGGYKEPSRSIKATTSKSEISFANNDCTVSSSTPTCTIEVSIMDSANYSNNNTINLTSSDISPNPNSISLNISNRRIIFASDGKWSGNLGGVNGANAKCQADSNNPDRLNSLWKAVLPDNVPYAKAKLEYFTKSGASVLNTNTTTNFAEIETLNNPIIEMDSKFGIIGIWTGNVSDNCNHWNSAEDNDYGLTGAANLITKRWMSDSTNACNNNHYLYCVQQ
ncbi:MAG: DUF1554 domain-containing protein [Neisseriales bacterium]|nr:MAG: DUF1554 domain-containing protein [Neisseriales bacterium]